MSEEKKVIAGAITYPPPDDRPQEPTPAAQPKQPTDLQGLLRFAMEATDGETQQHESHTGPIDNERKEFLENALKSMTVGVIEILESKINILQNADTLNENSDVTQHVLALETITDYVDHIDIANDFHKIGGFSIFNPCLKCKRAEIRAGACEVLAELCQNNPYCQRVVLDTGLIPTLLKLLSSDMSETVCAKSLYAISCIVRQHSEGFQQFVQYEGLTVLLKTLQKNDDKLITKTTFLLSSLCTSQPDLMSRLVFLDYVPALIKSIERERAPSHEHALSLLMMLASENASAASECKNPEHRFEEILRKHLSNIANKDECREEEDYCRQMLKLLFSSCNGL
ncbi:hypothetical protein FQR65_LT14885 [Abscondita terminalis]|nr:hypothetical protein FQR65_LT14885 [Abscondita terminalis]